MQGILKSLNDALVKRNPSVYTTKENNVVNLATSEDFFKRFFSFLPSAIFASTKFFLSVGFDLYLPL